MNTAVAHETVHAGTAPEDDPFHDPVVIGIGVTLVVVPLVIVAATGLCTWGTLDGSPLWGSHAFLSAVVH